MTERPSDEHFGQCNHEYDAKRAITVLREMGWRPNLAEMEPEIVRLRSAVDSLTRDRNLLREKLSDAQH